MSPSDVHIILPGTWEYITSHDKETSQILKIWGWEDYSGIPGQAQSSYLGLKTGEFPREMQCEMIQKSVSSFEDTRRGFNELRNIGNL